MLTEDIDSVPSCGPSRSRAKLESEVLRFTRRTTLFRHIRPISLLEKISVISLVVLTRISAYLFCRRKSLELGVACLGQRHADHAKDLPVTEKANLCIEVHLLVTVVMKLSAVSGAPSCWLGL